MENTLFSPDIFSRSHPEFKKAPTDTHMEVFQVLKEHYPTLHDDIRSVEQLVGLEINSRNFRLSSGSATFALKRINHTASFCTILNQLGLSQQLLIQGIPFPQIFRNYRGGLVSVMEDGYPWILAEFIEGDYFSGDMQDFHSIACAIGKLQSALDRVDPAGIPVSAAAGTWNRTCEILRDFLSREGALDKIFPAPESAALKREFGFIRTTFKQIVKEIPQYRSAPTITHIDLHPHNILITQKKLPVFVDVDSIQRADRMQSLAFSSFKLARQYVIHEKLSDTGDRIGLETKQFLTTLLDNIGDREVDIRVFPVLATAEIFRRIAIIIELNQEKRNRDWNKVLHMHLLALHEIPIIFSECVV